MGDVAGVVATPVSVVPAGAFVSSVGAVSIADTSGWGSTGETGVGSVSLAGTVGAVSLADVAAEGLVAAGASFLPKKLPKIEFRLFALGAVSRGVVLIAEGSAVLVEGSASEAEGSTGVLAAARGSSVFVLSAVEPSRGTTGLPTTRDASNDQQRQEKVRIVLTNGGGIERLRLHDSIAL